jgi:hypothetical protein
MFAFLHREKKLRERKQLNNADNSRSFQNMRKLRKFIRLIAAMYFKMEIALK